MATYSPFSDFKHECDWCGPCEADLNFLTDWPGVHEDGGYRDLKVCDDCLKEHKMCVPYEAAPKCEDCSCTMSDRDRFVYEREGGDGWPRCCEACAESPLTPETIKRYNERIKLS